MKMALRDERVAMLEKRLASSTMPHALATSSRASAPGPARSVSTSYTGAAALAAAAAAPPAPPSSSSSAVASDEEEEDGAGGRLPIRTYSTEERAARDAALGEVASEARLQAGIEDELQSTRREIESALGSAGGHERG